MTTTAKMTEEQMVGLVRNALIVAGLEMGGPEGDHWPVVKDTIHHVMKDWEELQTEREICGEIKKQYEKMISDLEALAHRSELHVKEDIIATVGRMREIMGACFSTINENDIYLSDNDIPAHVKRAEAIIKTLGGSDAA